jgi:hypothetical protein
MHMARGGMHRGGRGDARASCASPLGTPLNRNSQKYGLGIRDPETLILDPDPGIKKSRDPGSGTLDMGS